LIGASQHHHRSSGGTFLIHTPLPDAVHLRIEAKPGRDWVRNLESHPHLVLDSGEDSRTAVAAERAQATPAVSAYLRSMRAPWALRAFPVGPDAGLAEIIDHLDIIAVTGLFPITPVTTGWRRKRPLRFRCTRAVRQADGGVQV
jgi:hypothetical protein